MGKIYIDDCELYVLWNLYNKNLNGTSDELVKNTNLTIEETLSTSGNYYKISAHKPIEWNEKTMNKFIYKMYGKYKFNISKNIDKIVIYLNEEIRNNIEKDIKEYLEKFRDNNLIYNIQHATKFIDKISHQQTKNITSFEEQRDVMLKSIDLVRKKNHGKNFEIENPFSIIKMRKGDRQISSIRYSKRDKLFFHTLLALEAINLIEIKKIGFGNNFNLLFNKSSTEYEAEIVTKPKFEQWLRGNFIIKDLTYNKENKTLFINNISFDITRAKNQHILLSILLDDKKPKERIPYIIFDGKLTPKQASNTLNELQQKLEKRGINNFLTTIGKDYAIINKKYLN